MASKPAYALKSDALWQAYQTAQGSADHSARDCFNEVVGLEIAQRIKLLEDEIEAQVQHRLAVTRERDAALLKLPRWRKVEDDPPPPHVNVLTLMKHGCIEGIYDPAEGNFSQYYWRDMEWYATHWMPMLEPPTK